MAEEFTAADAAHIAGGGHLVLKLTKTNTWPEAIETIGRDPQVAERVESRCDQIDPDLIELIDANTDLVEHQVRSPKVSTAVCPDCMQTVMCSGTLAKTCFLTRDCAGALVKPAEYTIAAKKPKTAEIEEES